MNSMNRTSMFFSRPNVARAIISSSFTPRCTTAFTFTGAMPTAIAASMPSSTEASSSRLVICLNFSRFNVSRLTLMRRKPARFKSAATNASVAPLVVTATSIGWPANGESAVAGTVSTARAEISFVRWARTVGSPPVRRMPSTPKRSTQMRATRAISS